MIEAMIAGVRNSHQLAAMADRRIKASPKVLYDALHGRLTEHHRFMLELYLGQHDALGKAIAQIDAAADAAIARMDEAAEAGGQATFRSLILLLCSMPGVNILSATIILAEIGRDMSRFQTAGHLIAWAGMCPGQNESAGKRLRKGAPWLKFSRGRDAGHPAPPAQIRACAANALGSCLGCLTSKRWLGHGWRMTAGGIHPSMIRFMRSQGRLCR